MGLGIGDAFVGEPGIHLVIAPGPQPRREEPLTDQANLDFVLALLPARRRLN